MENVFLQNSILFLENTVKFTLVDNINSYAQVFTDILGYIIFKSQNAT